MAKEFKILRGNRVYLEIPEEIKSSVILDEAAQEQLERDKLREYGKLKVYAVGDLIQDLKEGDLVMIDPSSVTKVVKIPLSKTRDVMLVSTFDIAHVW